MDISDLLSKVRKFTADLNSRGIAIPFVRDPKTKIGSVSLTLVILSSMLVTAGILLKWFDVKLPATADVAMNSALEYFYATAALYFGRSWQSKGGAKLGGDGEEPKPAPASKTPVPSKVDEPS
jgi:hypothetical protein